MGKFTDISITDDQIKEHFMQYGNVVELQRPVDRSKNEAKNFCFVTYDKEEPAEMLLKKASVNVAGQGGDSIENHGLSFGLKNGL